MPLEQLYMWFSVVLLAIAVGVALKSIKAERRTRLNEAAADFITLVHQTYVIVDVGDGTWHWSLADLADGAAGRTFDCNHPQRVRIIRTLDRQDTTP